MKVLRFDDNYLFLCAVCSILAIAPVNRYSELRAGPSTSFRMDELPERLKHGPITFHLKAQLAAAGDSTKDPSVAWLDDRKVAELGGLRDKLGKDTGGRIVAHRNIWLSAARDNDVQSCYSATPSRYM